LNIPTVLCKKIIKNTEKRKRGEREERKWGE
jgi:hypothetical protein